MAITSELDSSMLVLAAAGYVVVSGLALWVLNLGLMAVGKAGAASFAKQSDMHRTVQQAVVKYVKPALNNILGTDAPWALKLEHLLLGAILVVLLGMWRTVFVTAELGRKEARAKAADSKKAAASSASSKKD